MDGIESFLQQGPDQLPLGGEGRVGYDCLDTRILMGTFPVDHVDVAVPAKRYLTVGDFATTGFLLLSARASAISAATH